MMTPFLLSAVMVLQAGAIAPTNSEDLEPLNTAEFITTEDYPSAAALGDVTGVVAVVMDVGADGKVISCRVSDTSGSAELDAVPCRNRGRLRFPIAPSTASREYRTNVQFELPGRALSFERYIIPVALPPQFDTIGFTTKVVCLFGPDGRAERCQTSVSSGDVDLDNAVVAALISACKITPPKAGPGIRAEKERAVVVQRGPGSAARPAKSLPLVVGIFAR